MTGCGSCCTDPKRTAIVFRAGPIESLCYAWLDIALRLTTNRSQLRNYKVTRAFKHPLLAEREWLGSAYLLLFDLLDGPDPVIWIYDFLADFKPHTAPPSIQKSDCAARAGLGKPLGDAARVGPLIW